MNPVPRACGAGCATLAVGAAAAAADSVIRVGEHDTCDITTVTTVSYDSGAKTGHIRFDLSTLPEPAKCVRGVLRFWVDGFADHRQWPFGPWAEKDFDGFKVWLQPSTT